MSVMLHHYIRPTLILQQEVSDVMLIDDRLFDSDEDVNWLSMSSHPAIPIVYLCPEDSPRLSQAFDLGICQWLPQELAQKHPLLLESAIEQAIRMKEPLQKMQEIQRELIECRRQTTRLASMLWQVTPGNDKPHWYSQRYMLERLEEEVSRTDRYGHPLSIVLGEVKLSEVALDASHPAMPEQDPFHRLDLWTASKVIEGKRRPDIAGQYGSHGFMLLLPNTAAEGAEDCCRRLQSVLEQEPFQPSENTRLQICSCLGMANTPRNRSRYSLPVKAGGRSTAIVSAIHCLVGL